MASRRTDELGFVRLPRSDRMINGQGKIGRTGGDASGDINGVKRLRRCGGCVDEGKGAGIALALLVATIPASYAQPAGIVPSEPARSVDPSPTPIPAKPDLTAEPAPRAVAPAAAGEATATIQAYDVTGNTLLEQATIERTVYPFLGPSKRGADVEAAIAALQAVYNARGYQSVSVGRGAIDEATGTVQLVVTEARVGRLRVSGAKWYSPRAVRDQVQSLEEGEVPNLEETQRELAAMERTGADRRVSPKITTGRIPGTIDVDLQVEDSLPLHLSSTVSNDHSPNTVPLRVLTNFRATNLWQAGHTFSFSYLVAPQRRSDAEVYAGSYLAPIANSSWSILLYGYKSNSNVALLGGASVLGNGYAIGARAVLALPTTGNWSHSINFGADYKDFIEDTNIPNATPSKAPVHYMPTQITYNAQRVGVNSTLSTTVAATFGLRIFDKGKLTSFTDKGKTVIIDDPLFDNKRPGSRESFIHVNADMVWNHSLKDDTRLIARVAAQYSDQPLISNEQFSAGGIASVRGYLQSEAVGDDGISGTLEARTPSWTNWLGKSLNELRGFGYIDGAFVRSRQIQAEQANNFGLLGIGVGLRAQVFHFLSGDVELGVPMLDGSTTRVGNADVQFNVKAEF